MNAATLKQIACERVDQQRERLIAIGEQLWANPEPGFQEFKTAQLVQQTFDEMGIEHQDGLAITGVRATLRGGSPGPTFGLLGEMDALILPDHPESDPATGAVHACGHHAQVAGLLGAAMALHTPGILEHLSGNVALMAVPAEEFIQIGYRQSLRHSGKLSFLGGKQEMIKRGCFDDIDLSMMIHTTNGFRACVRQTMNGFTAQTIAFKGRSAHAGSSPFRGVNALNAANLALQAIHSQRETFADHDHVRIHPIITHGGDSVSIVPENVRIENMARAATLEAIMDANTKIKRCCQAGALATGADVSIVSIPGYCPLNDCLSLQEVFIQNVRPFLDGNDVTDIGHLCSSTDMGDVTQIMPASHPSIGGAEGQAHTTDYRITDPELAYVVPAKVLAMCVIDLLTNKASVAGDIIARHVPLIHRDNYRATMEQQASEEHHRYLTKVC